MATLNYSKRLNNIRARKFDTVLNESTLSKAFDSYDMPENLKYLMESMRPIGKKYNDITLQASENVRNHLERELTLHFGRDYRTQGSVICNTNIQLHSDIDLLSIVARYAYLHPELPNNNPYDDSDPAVDIEQLRNQATKIMKSTYDTVDDLGVKSIWIYNKNLRRKVDIVFAYWYNTSDYYKNSDEYYRGVQLYDFHTRQRQGADYPFAHIQNVNWKGANTNDGSRRGIRLLKNLKADSDQNIDLSSFQLTTIVHSIENTRLQYRLGSEWSIGKAVSEEMNTLIEIPTYREQVKSPNGTEHPFLGDSTVAEIKKLKADLDELLVDTAQEVQSPVLIKAMLTY
jgi:hypothetical protein